MTGNESLFAGKNALITGGLGFIGSALARRLVELRANVLILDSMLPETGANLFNICGIENRLRVNISDVRDRHSMAYLVQGQHFLFNLAGQTSHLDSMEDPYADLDINCRAQLFILEACRRHNPEIRVAFASTRQIYGRPDSLPVNEDHPLRPVDVNGINKMAGEWYHILYHNVFGVRSCSLRLTNTYGPRMRIKDARQTFLGVWIRKLLEGEPFEVWDGAQKRDFTYVDDAVEALLLAAGSDESGGRVFNLGGDYPITLKELAGLLIEINGGGKYVIRDFPAERKPIDIGDYYADYSRAQRYLGWRPKIGLRDGLESTLRFYREHLSRYV